jgi:hypothetical protein
VKGPHKVSCIHPRLRETPLHSVELQRQNCMHPLPFVGTPRAVLCCYTRIKFLMPCGTHTTSQILNITTGWLYAWRGVYRCRQQQGPCTNNHRRHDTWLTTETFTRAVAAHHTAFPLAAAAHYTAINMLPNDIGILTCWSAISCTRGQSNNHKALRLQHSQHTGRGLGRLMAGTNKPWQCTLIGYPAAPHFTLWGPLGRHSQPIPAPQAPTSRPSSRPTQATPHKPEQYKPTSQPIPQIHSAAPALPSPPCFHTQPAPDSKIKGLEPPLHRPHNNSLACLLMRRVACSAAECGSCIHQQRHADCYGTATQHRPDNTLNAHMHRTPELPEHRQPTPTRAHCKP